jgi:ankyrin repeat protein
MENQSAALLVSAKRNKLAGATRARSSGSNIHSGNTTETVTYYITGPNSVKKGHRVPVHLDDQATAIHWAASNGYTEMASLLLNREANLNHSVSVGASEWSSRQRIPTGQSFKDCIPLDYYPTNFTSRAVVGNAFLGLECLEYPQAISTKYRFMRLEQGVNPLYFAVEGGKIEIAESLIKAGADLTTHTGTGLNALQPAVSNGDVSMAKYPTHGGD